MSKNLRVYMKDPSAQNWTDVTKSCTQTAFKQRRGFGRLGDTSDVGKLTIEYRADDLASAVLFHTSAKLIRITSDGAVVFEGYTEGNAKVQSTARTDLAWVRLNAFPYSHLFRDVDAPGDLVFRDMQILNPAEPSRSLVHQLVDRLYDLVDEPYRSILSGVTQRVQSDVTITKVLPIAVIEEGESILETLDSLLGEYCLARYMAQLQMIIVEPYSQRPDRPVRTLSFGDIMARPKLDTAPFVLDEKTVLTLAKIRTMQNQTVFRLYEDGEGPSEGEAIKPGGTYPLDAEVFEARYEGEDSETLELFHCEGVSYTYRARFADNSGDAELAITAQLDSTSATFTITNSNSKPVYLNQLTVTAEQAYYRDTSLVIEDSTVRGAKDINDVESVYMVDASDAEKYINTYRAQLQAEKFSFRFSTDKVSIEPDELLRVGDIPFTVLARYVEEDLSTGEISVDAVAYDVKNIRTSSKVIGSSATGGVQYINLSLTGTAYTYASDGTLKPDSQLIYAEVKRYGLVEPPQWTINGEPYQSAELRIPVDAQAMEGRTYITVGVKVGRLTAEQYIYRITDGSDYPPIVEYKYSISPSTSYTDLTTLTSGADIFEFGGIVFVSSPDTGWSKDIPQGDHTGEYLWRRVWSYELKKWIYERLTGDPARSFSIEPSSQTYGMSSRSYVTKEQTISFRANMQNITATPVWRLQGDPEHFRLSSQTGEVVEVTVLRGCTSSSFTITCTVGGLPPQSLRIAGVRAGEPMALYLDVVDDTLGQQKPTETADGPLMVGDYILWIYQGEKGKETIPQYWDGTAWASVEGETAGYSTIMSTVMADVLRSDATVPSTSALYGFFANLAAENAFISNLIVEKLNIKDEEGNFLTRIQSADPVKGTPAIFDVQYNSGNGLKTIFKIVPASGNVFLGEPNAEASAPVSGFMYDASRKILRSKAGNFSIDENGNVKLKGTLDGAGGTFTGSIDCPSFSSEPTSAGDFVRIGMDNAYPWDQRRIIDSNTVTDRFYECSVSLNPNIKWMIRNSFDWYDHDKIIDYILFYDASRQNVLAKFTLRYSFQYGQWKVDNDPFGGGSFDRITYDLYLKRLSDDIFKFKKLPINPSLLEPGQVWVDYDGILHMVKYPENNN